MINYSYHIEESTLVPLKQKQETKKSSLSTYTYAFNDPVYWNDPLGDAPNTESVVPSSIRNWTAYDPNYHWMYQGDAHMVRGVNYTSTYTGSGSGYHWTDQIRTAEENMMFMSSNTFRNFYGVDHMSADERSRFDAGFATSDPAVAKKVLGKGLEYIEVFMADMLPNGMGLDVAGQRFHVYTDPDMIAGVLDYYLNRFSGSAGSADRASLQGGYSLTSRYGAGPVPLTEGRASGEINIDHLGGSAGGKGQVSTFWKGIAESFNRILKLNKEFKVVKRNPIEVNLNNQTNSQVRPHIDSFLNITKPVYYWGNDSLRQKFQGFAVDGVDTSRFIMYPDSTFFPYDTYLDESLPTNVIKINKNQ